MTVDELRQHLQYSGWASKRLLDAAAALDPEPLSRELGVSHHSVLDTLSHIYLADRIWYTRVVEPDLPVRADPVPLQTLRSDWPAIQQRWETWANSLTDSDLARVVSYRTFKGDPLETPVWQIVLHVVNHATLHRGQVMAMLRQLGVPPPPTDLIFFYRTLTRKS